MNGTRIHRFAACLLSVSSILLTVAPPLVAGIGIPPPPPPPGWGLVTPIIATNYASAFTAKADGSKQVVAFAEWDTVMYTYNLSTVSRTPYGWSPAKIATGLFSFDGPYMASTDQTDRQAVLAFVGAYGGPEEVYITFFAQSTSPAAPVQISDTPGVDSMALAATPHGDVMAMWRTYNGSYGLYANHSGAGAPFDGSLPIVENAEYISDYWLVAVGEDTFAATWIELNGSLSHLWGSVFTNASGWGSPVELLSPAASIWGLSAAGSATAGRGAIVAWSGEGPNATLWLVKYTDPNWWGPEPLANISEWGINTYWGPVAVDGAGNTHIVWSLGPELSRVQNLTYGRMDGGNVWVDAWQRQVASPESLQIAVSGSGGAAVSWIDSPDGIHRRAWVTRYVPNSGWRAVEEIDIVQGPTHASFALRTALATSGNFTAVWQNDDGYDAQLTFREFIAGNTPPALRVVSPVDATTTTSPTVLVQGATTPGAQVWVEGIAAAVAADGSFSSRVALTNGTNTLSVRSVDGWGNWGQVWLNVTFEDPVPGLEADLAAAEAAAAAAQAEALIAHEATHTVQQRADATEARAANLSDQLNHTNEIYQHQQSDLEFLRASSSAATNATASAQAGAGTAMALGAVGLLAGLAGVGMSFMRRPGGGGGGETRMSDRPAQQAQAAEPASRGKPEPQGPSPPPSGGGGPP